MTEAKLSNTMASALLEIEHAGGTVERQPGGYWVLPGNKIRSQWWGTSTIQALVDRGKLEYIQHQDGRKGSFPIAAKVVTP